MATIERFDAARRCVEAQRRQLSLPPLDPAYGRYAALRRAALEEGSLLKWLALQRYRGLYADMFTRRQRLGDLYLILKGRKR